MEAGRGLWEFRVEDAQLGDFAVGGEVKADIFEVGQIVDVQGVTKGKGFQGTIKRHNFRMGDATHGNSLSHRAPGSLGQRQTPGRVFRARRCRATWARCSRAPRTWKWSRSTSSAV